MEDISKALGHKLKYAVDIFDDDVILFIGSKSAFFFVGTKQEFHDVCEKESMKRLAHLHKEVGTSRTKIAITLEDVKHRVFEGTDADIDQIERVAKLLAQYCRDNINARNQLSEFLAFGERTVKDVYIRDAVEPNEKEIVLKVSGIEAGNYWTRNEWKSEHRTN